MFVLGFHGTLIFFFFASRQKDTMGQQYV